ncbi:LysR family transcriptional regulator [Methanothermococcus sp. Ax23]|jgi:molybdenum-dependent DNA-binding transcriptional regulator ModE|uniref:helix-turn-helix domain-containing protein n=1 Tax=Methanothermococcus sp. Ax23 TaxID=3156486 RepID=UPI003BA0FC9E
MTNLTTTLNIKYDGKSITENQIKILKLISEKKSQNKVAKILNIPPSSVNIQIKRLEEKLGVKLIYSSTSGTILTEPAQNIVKYYESVQKRVSKHPFIACGFISGELGKILFDDILISSFDNILKLYEMDLTSIVGIDDPYWSFRLGEPIPIAYDHFIMAYKENFNVKNLIGIRYSPQRIVWNILKNQNVDFKITKVVKNPFYAIDLIEDGYSLFLNESFAKYIKKDYVIEKPYFYEKTKHTLNFIASNEEHEKLINHVVNKKKKEIESRGFEVIECF